MSIPSPNRKASPFKLVNGRYVRVNNTKPIGSGKNAGCTRSMIPSVDIQLAFKAKMHSSVYHKWTN